MSIAKRMGVAALLSTGMLLSPGRANAQNETHPMLAAADSVYAVVLKSAGERVQPSAVRGIADSIEALSAPMEIDALIQRGVVANLRQLAGMLEMVGADTTFATAKLRVAASGVDTVSGGRLAARVHNSIIGGTSDLQAQQLKESVIAQAQTARISILSLYQNLIALTSIWQQRRPVAPIPQQRMRRFGMTGAAYGSSALGAGAATTWGRENSSWIAQAEYAMSTDSVRGSEVSLAMGREVGTIALLAGASYAPDRETELAPAATVLVRVGPGAYVGAALSAQHGAGFRVLFTAPLGRR